VPWSCFAGFFATPERYFATSVDILSQELDNAPPPQETPFRSGQTPIVGDTVAEPIEAFTLQLSHAAARVSPTIRESQRSSTTTRAPRLLSRVHPGTHAGASHRCIHRCIHKRDAAGQRKVRSQLTR
jgi:hypothetical protein